MGGRARLTIVAVGCALLVGGAMAALARSAPQRTGTNDVLTTVALGSSTGRVALCQDDERLPSGTGAVRVSLSTTSARGPRIAVAARSNGATIARGTLPAGWRGEAATVPLRPVVRAAHRARVCMTIGASASVLLRGQRSSGPGSAPPATSAGEPLEGRLRLDYLAPRPRSWFAQAGTIVKRMGFGHALHGASVALLAALLLLSAVSLALVQVVRGAE